MKRFCSMALVVLLLLAMIPTSVFASIDENAIEAYDFTVIGNAQSTLAPGVSLNEVVMYNGNNQRVEMYVTTVDTTVDTVQIKANYMDNQNQVYGMQTLTEQVAAMEANYPEPFKVVAGINASYYDVISGKPTGAFVMEGIDVTTEAEGNNYAFFAVLKDGTYMIGAKGEYSSYKGQIQEAVGGWIHIVKDGAIASGLDKTTLYPRQTLGLTEDGKVILMTADGSQAPATVGLTIEEQAEIMLALGCVEAIHLDGGNSGTFSGIREGEDTFGLISSPSGGAERAVSNTLVVISTAVADGTFARAVIESDYDYFAANSTYTFTTFGVDSTSAPAPLPENITWALSDSSFGTISDGKFVSNGKLGEVDIQILLDGKVVGTRPITVAHPTAFAFEATETTVPYAKSAPLNIVSMYGNFEMYSGADAYTFTIDPAAAGTMEGFMFTAANNEAITEAVATAAYKYDSSLSTSSIKIKFGKGSEILFDFEDGDIDDWKGTDTIRDWITEFNADHPNAKYPVYQPDKYGNSVSTQSATTFLATEEDGGRVKSGKYSLGLTLDRLNADGVGSWIYNYLYYTGDTQIWRDVANGKSAVRVGMWVNMPQSGTNTAFRICRTFTKDATGKLYTNYDYMTSDYDGKKLSYNTNYAIPEDGWFYVYFDLTSYDFQSTTQFSETESYGVNNGKDVDGDYFPAFIQFINGSANDTMEKTVIYIDDISLDYSDVTEDRDAPVISNATVCSDTANFVALNGQTVNNNLLSFSANVTDVSGNSNATGLDYTSAKVLIDGVDVTGGSNFKAANGVISLNDVSLANGTHSIAFEICDKQGNRTIITKSLVVAGAETNSVVSVFGHNNSNTTPKAGSVYFVDIKATEASSIQSITAKIKTNSANTLEYNNIICADGVTAETSYNVFSDELTLTIKNSGILTGEQILASIPVRVWSWDEEETGISASAQFNSGAIPVINIEVKAEGEVVYSASANNSYVGGFYGTLNVATELDNKTVWHAHTEDAVSDVANTCTEDGYSGRTYCEGCDSVVSWGTKLKATGHDWQFNSEGVLACANDATELFNGVYTDGKTYVDGVVVADGWVEVDGEKTYYYVDGVKLTGSHFFDDEIHTFDDDGTYLPDYIYDGWFTYGDTVMYFINNKYVTDYLYTEFKPFYFDNYGMARDGEYIIDGVVCLFDDGEFVSSESSNIVTAGWIGDEVTFVITTDGTLKLGGKGISYTLNHATTMPWFSLKENIIKAFVGNEIINLPRFAFANCYQLTEVEFEENSKLEIISYQAFKGLYRMKNLVLPESATKIEWGAFGYMYAIESIYVPAGVTYIHNDILTGSNKAVKFIVHEGSYAESYAKTKGIGTEVIPYVPKVVASGSCGDNATWSLNEFGDMVISGSGAMTNFANRNSVAWKDYCSKIKTITIGKDITSISDYAFGWCHYVEKVTFEEGSKVENIGGNAFHSFTKTVEIKLPSTVKKIGYSAFGYGTQLVSINIPASVTYMHPSAFLNHRADLVLSVVEGSYAQTYAEAAGIATEVVPYEPVIIASGSCGDNATWSLNEFGDMVISGSGAMVNFKNRNSVAWKDYALKIKTITIGKDITSISNYAFGWCHLVEKVTFEEGSKVEVIGNNAFHSFTKVTSITLPETVKSIGYSAFGYGTQLVSINIPASVTYMHPGAFLNHRADLVLTVEEGSYAADYAESNGINVVIK